jgi:hypothetical protein
MASQMMEAQVPRTTTKPPQMRNKTKFHIWPSMLTITLIEVYQWLLDTALDE